MIELIVAHPHAFWLSLGGLLLAAEMLGGNGYLLWSGVAAVITGLLVWILPLDWAWQGALFAALGRNGINIRMISQGPEELNIIVGVDDADFEKAVRVIYESFVK